VVESFRAGQSWMEVEADLYNWQELEHAHRFGATSGGELLFHLLRFKGPQALDLVEGPYALAFFDGEAPHLARDTVGLYRIFYRECSHNSSTKLFSFEPSREPGWHELHPRQILTASNSQPGVSFTPRNFPEPVEGDLLEVLKSAIHSRLPGKQQVTLFLSGGVDSALLAAIMKDMKVNFKAITVGLVGCSDFVRANRVAERMDIPLKLFEVNPDTALATVPEICERVGSSDPVKIEVGLVTHFACLFCDTPVAFSGLGPDELMGGYARMHRSPHLEALWALRNLWHKTAPTGFPVIRPQGKILRWPYLDSKVVAVARGLSDLELTGKWAVRQLLADLGYPDLAEEGKKAAQYGSGFSKILPSPKSEYLKNYWPANRRLLALVSGGKDSWSAIMAMTRLNYPVAGMVCMAPARDNSWMFQTPQVDLIREQAEASGIPLLVRPTSGEKEKELIDLEAAIHQAAVQFKAEGVVSGAISSEYQRSRIEDICERLGLSCHAPLWGTDSEAHLRASARDMDFVIVSVAADGLDARTWVGRPITPETAEELIALSRKFKFNPAGEGGEFETFVRNCPLFSKSIDYKPSKHIPS